MIEARAIFEGLLLCFAVPCAGVACYGLFLWSLDLLELGVERAVARASQRNQPPLTGPLGRVSKFVPALAVYESALAQLAEIRDLIGDEVIE